MKAEQFKVEKVSTREVEPKPGDSWKAFTSYSIAAAGRWYGVRGKGHDRIKEGDTITGTVTSRPGSEGKIYYDIELLDPTMAEVFDRLDKLEAVVFPPEEDEDLGF